MLDLGASVGADAKHLVDLSIMGSAMARIILHVERPTVGLLNVGTEEIKGVEEVKEASKLLREAQLPNLDYRGFVEGDSIGKGVVDVVVTEGFAGNIALKPPRGRRRKSRTCLREAMGRSLLTKLGAAARPVAPLRSCARNWTRATLTAEYSLASMALS